MNINILSINGNSATNSILKTVISNKYEVITVTTVFAGIRAIKNYKKIDVILIDIDHQTEQCFQFIEYLRSTWLYQCRIIALASLQNKNLADKLIQADVYNLYIKPFNPQVLAKKIDEFILSDVQALYN
ncbi:MAG: response regulator [Chitinophagaceae bacterium]|jgi:DNA-binding NtrC family response regulator|nr:response regulator [Chitinophagaceae bacterium]